MSWLKSVLNPSKQPEVEHIEFQRLTSRDNVSQHYENLHGNVSQQPEPYSRTDQPSSLGITSPKAITDKLDILSLCLAWACFATAGSIVGIPFLAYRIGYNNQMIIIGLLLSVQLLCFKRIAPTVFARLEEHVGASCLQSFDAILLNSVTVSGSSGGWKTVILVFTILPIGLSAAYKRYAGGFATSTLSTQGHHYGLAGPGDLTNLAYHTGQSLMVNATIPFMTATANLEEFVQDSELPRAFGFNTLLLSNTSTAVLDAPWPDAVSQLQSMLGVDEKFTLAAQVYATVTRYNDLLDFHRDPADPFWQEFPFDQGGWYLYANHCFNGGMIGYRSDFGGPPEPTGGNQSWVMMGAIPSYGDYLNPLPMDSPSYTDFNNSAMLFYNKREICYGTWTITRNSIDLSSGACAGVALSDEQQQIISNNTLDLTSWYMSLTTEFLCPFTPQHGYASPWLVPTMTTFTATMIWSRLVGVEAVTGGRFSDQTYYLLSNDTLQHTVPVMRSPASVFVVVVLPALSSVLFVINFFCYRGPVGKGFGLVSILAGVDGAGLWKLSGAEYSGRLSTPVKLRVREEVAGIEDSGRERKAKVVYSII